MQYKSVTVTRIGPPEAIQVVEQDLRPPSADEVRVKVLATPVCLPDVEARYGRTPFAPKVPFVPGYAVIGSVDAIGKRVAEFAIGNRAAALTAYGGYAEYVYLDRGQLIPVPSTLDPAEAVPLILNYIVAYQSLHRCAQVEAGDKVLIIDASGGIGTAFLQLGQLAHLTIYGIASKRKHHVLTRYGATPIDYHTQDFVEVIRKAEPDGLEAVFDGVGGGLHHAEFLAIAARRHICGVRQPPDPGAHAAFTGAGRPAQPFAERTLGHVLQHGQVSP